MPAQRDYSHDDRSRPSYRDGAPREDRSDRRRGIAPPDGRSAPQPYHRDERGARFAASPPPPPPPQRNHQNGGGAPYSRGESSRSYDYGPARGAGALDDRSRQREYSRHNDDARSRLAPYDDRRRDDSYRNSNNHSAPHAGSTTAPHAPSPPPPLKSALKRPASPIVEDYDLDPEAEEARLIEERRRKRAAILAKHAGTASSSDVATPPTMAPTPSAAESVAASSLRGSVEPRGRTRSASPATRQVSVDAFSLAKSGLSSPTTAAASHAEASAADYNPDDDRLEDEERARVRAQQHAAQPKTLDALAAGTGEAPARLDGAESEYEEIEVTDDEVDDMFALDEEEESKPKKKVIRVKKGEHRQTAIAAATGHSNVAGIGAVGPTLTDNFDDADGYYRIVLGERIGEAGRYHVFATLGRGMFSSVVKARDTRPPTIPGQPTREREVAIKIVRSQETMYKAGIKEMAVLRKLADLDPDDKRHVIRLDGHFEHRGHLCMVFELLSMNLRDVVKRFGKDVGLNLRAVRAYAHQMFLALALMRKANIMHADIKPDNILVNDAKTTLKVCDLGSASDTSEMEITPYLVSRFYRAPEIILGQPYDCSLDMWSIGCTLYELATGKILFPGRTNNQMLLLIQELRGKFTTKQIRKGRFAAQHFDESNVFMSLEKDKSTGADVVRKMALQKPVRDLRAKLLPGATAKRLAEDELRLHNHFIDLLNRALELDPAKRLTPKEALAHPFLAT